MSDAALARAALALWRGAGEPHLVWQSENVVYRARLDDGAEVALRLHRAGYQDREGIAAELDWCARLSAAGVAVCAPVALPGGGYVAEVSGRLVSCLRWIEGAPLGQADAPLAGSALLARAEALGALIADLHAASDAGACPAGFPRPAWDAEALLGAAPRWGRFWENPTLTAEEAADLLSARDLARERIGAAGDFGPIHADVLRGNVMLCPDGLRLIDFDDSGPGYRLYDLASALIQSWGDPDLPAQARALVAGYRSRRMLPGEQVALLPLFLALRAFASAGWIVTRAPRDDPRQRSYALRAVALARDLIAGHDPLGGAV